MASNSLPHPPPPPNTQRELGYHSELLVLVLPAVRLPQLDGVIVRPRGERGAVRAPNDRPNRICMAREGLEQRAVRLPQLDGVIDRPRGERKPSALHKSNSV